VKPRARQLLNQRGSEVARAGRMFFDAVFGTEREAFLERTGAELERELEQRRAIEVRTCERCGVTAAHSRGWTYDGTAWACPTCSKSSR
jgi:hypothetical protein